MNKKKDQIELTKIKFHNFILLLKPKINSAKLSTIQKLTKSSKKLKTKFARNDTAKQNCLKRADSYFHQIQVLKKISNLDIGKFLTLNTKSPEKVLEDPACSVELKALVRIAANPEIATDIKQLREDYPNWAQEIPDLIKSFGVNRRKKHLTGLRGTDIFDKFVEKEWESLVLLDKLVGLNLDPKLLKLQWTSNNKKEIKALSLGGVKTEASGKGGECNVEHSVKGGVNIVGCDEDSGNESDGKDGSGCESDGSVVNAEYLCARSKSRNVKQDRVGKSSKPHSQTIINLKDKKNKRKGGVGENAPKEFSDEVVELDTDVLKSTVKKRKRDTSVRDAPDAPVSKKQFKDVVERDKENKMERKGSGGNKLKSLTLDKRIVMVDSNASEEDWFGSEVPAPVYQNDRIRDEVNYSKVGEKGGGVFSVMNDSKDGGKDGGGFTVLNDSKVGKKDGSGSAVLNYSKIGEKVGVGFTVINQECDSLEIENKNAVGTKICAPEVGLLANNYVEKSVANRIDKKIDARGEMRGNTGSSKMIMEDSDTDYEGERSVSRSLLGNSKNVSAGDQDRSKNMCSESRENTGGSRKIMEDSDTDYEDDSCGERNVSRSLLGNSKQVSAGGQDRSKDVLFQIAFKLAKFRGKKIENAKEKKFKKNHKYHKSRNFIDSEDEMEFNEPGRSRLKRNPPRKRKMDRGPSGNGVEDYSEPESGVLLSQNKMFKNYLAGVGGGFMNMRGQGRGRSMGVDESGEIVGKKSSSGSDSFGGRAKGREPSDMTKHGGGGFRGVDAQVRSSDKSSHKPKDDRNKKKPKHGGKFDDRNVDNSSSSEPALHASWVAKKKLSQNASLVHFQGIKKTFD